jgi:hypothetical protein
MENLPTGLEQRRANGWSRPTAREQVSLALLSVGQAGRGRSPHAAASRLLRWRYRSEAADELLLAPPDLQVADASFADEVASGAFGLGGWAATLGGRSPSPSRRRARNGHESCTASAGCATSTTRRRRMPKRSPSNWSANGSGAAAGTPTPPGGPMSSRAA